MSMPQCKIKDGVSHTGRIGTIHHNCIVIADVIWSAVVWAGSSSQDPELIRTNQLLVAKPSWVEAKGLDIYKLKSGDMMPPLERQSEVGKGE